MDEKKIWQDDPEKLKQLDLTQFYFKCQLQEKYKGEQQIIFIAFTSTHIVKFKDNNFKEPISFIRYKFGIRLQWVDNNLGQKIGFKLMKDNIQEITEIFAINTVIILKIKQILSKKLNQCNFHETFKAYKRIGKGNFASVYLVSEIESGIKYAVKAFSKEIAYSQLNGRKSIKNEINIMRQIDHPNLIKVQEIYETNNSLYIILNYCEGNNLLDLLKQKGKLDHEQAMSILIGLLKGIEYLHSKKIMHRDIKPENILLQTKEKMHPVLVDFGLATYTSNQKFLFTRCGTPGYVAPEIANLKEKDELYDEKCDIFSFGVIMHMVLLGKILFKGNNFNEVLKMNKQCNINFQNSVYQNMDKDARDIMFKTLSYNPKNRPTASQILSSQFFSQAHIQQQGFNLGLGNIPDDEDEDENVDCVVNQQSCHNQSEQNQSSDLGNIQFHEMNKKQGVDKVGLRDSQGTFNMQNQSISINTPRASNPNKSMPNKKLGFGVSIDEIKTPKSVVVVKRRGQGNQIDYLTPSNFMRIKEEEYDNEPVQVSQTIKNAVSKRNSNMMHFSDYTK